MADYAIDQDRELQTDHMMSVLRSTYSPSTDPDIQPVPDHATPPPLALAAARSNRPDPNQSTDW